MSSPRDRNIILLSGIFVASLVAANLLGSKLIVLYGITLSVGVFIIPVTFLMTDLLGELYGKDVAGETVKIGLWLLVYTLFFVWLGGLFPASPRRDLTEAYQQMFSLAPRMILASIIAYLASQFLDVKVFHYLKTKTNDKHLWLRNNVSTMLSQAVDTFVFFVIFLVGVLPAIEIVKAGIAVYLFKVIIAALDTPFIYIGKRLLQIDETNATHKNVTLATASCETHPN